MDKIFVDYRSTVLNYSVGQDAKSFVDTPKNSWNFSPLKIWLYSTLQLIMILDNFIIVNQLHNDDN